MLILTGKLKVLKVNSKPTMSCLKKLKEGDTITVTFNVTGKGGNSPKVDIYVNGTYTGKTFARAFNDSVYGHYFTSITTGNETCRYKGQRVEVEEVTA